jgi:hypothetical protein
MEAHHGFSGDFWEFLGQKILNIVSLGAIEAKYGGILWQISGKKMKQKF